MQRTGRPVRRTVFRRWGGMIYYHLRRQYQWRLSGRRYARRRRSEDLPFVLHQHATPLLRDLAGVEMRLQQAKIVNLRLAVRRLDGLVIEPGEYFSFWRVLGRPTRAKGYAAGMVLRQGRPAAGVGGGLCQLSNLVYWLTLHTSLTVAERWRHSYDVFPDAERKAPFGSGATCAYPSLDLQLRNETLAAVQLRLRITDTHLEGEWRSTQPPHRRYEVYQASHAITHEPWGGYIRHNVLRRRVFNLEGSLLADEFVAENHALMMYRPFLPERTPEP